MQISLADQLQFFFHPLMNFSGNYEVTWFDDSELMPLEDRLMVSEEQVSYKSVLQND